MNIVEKYYLSVFFSWGTLRSTWSSRLHFSLGVRGRCGCGPSSSSSFHQGHSSHRPAPCIRSYRHHLPSCIPSSMPKQFSRSVLLRNSLINFCLHTEPLSMKDSNGLTNLVSTKEKARFTPYFVPSVVWNQIVPPNLKREVSNFWGWMVHLST